jgi:hypothetical protein
MKILVINARAFFTAYGCHNWNLLLGDASKSLRKAISFLGFLKRIYPLFFQIFEEVSDFEPRSGNGWNADWIVQMCKILIRKDL